MTSDTYGPGGHRRGYRLVDWDGADVHGPPTQEGLRRMEEEDVADDAARLQVLIDAGKRLASSMDFASLMVRILDAAMRVTGAQRACLVSKDRMGDSCEILLARVGHDLVPEPRSHSFSRSVVDWVAGTGEPLLLADAGTDQRFAKRTSVADWGLRSILCAPVLVRGETVKVVYLENNLLSNAFARKHVDLLRVLTSQASIALENVLAYRACSDLNVQLTAKVQELQQATDKLRRAQQEVACNEKLATIGRMAGTIIHELSNYLFLDSLTDQVRSNHAGDPQLEQLLDGVKSMRDLLANLLSNYRNLVQGSREEDALQDCDVGSLAEMTVQLCRQAAWASGVHIEASIQEGAFAHLDAGRIRQVLVNLVKNACQASPAGGTVTVHVAHTGGTVCIRVADEGSGVAATDDEQIFRPFFSTRGETGLGLGLSLCRAFVEEHGGAIGFNRNPDRGTTFYFTLPAVPAPAPSPTAG